MFKNTISQDLQDAIKKVMEANLHPNQQKIDVHEPEKDKITAHDFKKLRAMKKDQHGKITKEDTDSQIQELAGKAAQQAAIAISLIKAGKKDGKMPKPMREEQTDEAHTPSHQAATTMKHIPNASPALKKAAKDIKPGIAGYRDRIAMLKAGGVKEEVEELDELKKSTLASYAKSAGISSTINRKIAADFEKNSEKSRSPGMKSANVAMSQKYKEKSWKRRDGAAKAIDRLAKEEVEQEVAEGWDDMLKANKERAAAADKAKGTGKFDKKELSPGATQYTRKSKTFTDGGSDADLRKANRKSNEEVDETTVIHNSFTVNLKEAYTFGEYLQAAKSIVGEDEAVMLANKAFGAQDVGIFEQAITIQNMIEEMNNLEKAGHSISEPKYNIELGNPYYEYTVTEDTGARRKYIHHGDVVTN